MPVGSGNGHKGGPPPQLGRILDQLRAGNVVVVSRLNRLARSTRDSLETAEKPNEAQAGLTRANSSQPFRRGRMLSTTLTALMASSLNSSCHAGRDKSSDRTPIGRA